MTFAVVTGAGRGIGRATALAFAARGLDVALLGRHRDDLESAARELVTRHPDRGALAIECDVSSAEQVAQSAERVSREYGTPLVVVNNAGVVERARVDVMTEARWDHVLDVNLKGAFLVTRAFLPALYAAKQGRIVHVSSISATLGTASQSAYCASKWGLVGFMKALAEELRGSGVQTCAVLPGSVDTEMLKGSGFAPQMAPEDVAAFIVQLALDVPDAIHGSAVDFFGP